MEEIRILSPTGVIGSGFLESSFERGISMKPHVIPCDAGSTDPGPAHLGSGITHFSREATKRDLRIMLRGRDTLGVPLILGSCGTGGGDAGGIAAGSTRSGRVAPRLDVRLRWLEPVLGHSPGRTLAGSKNVAFAWH